VAFDADQIGGRPADVADASGGNDRAVRSADHVRGQQPGSVGLDEPDDLGPVEDLVGHGLDIGDGRSGREAVADAPQDVSTVE